MLQLCLYFSQGTFVLVLNDKTLATEYIVWTVTSN